MIMMTVTRLLTIMMTILLAPETMERAPVTTSPMMSRMTLIQQQACSQDMARVVCRCPGELETQGPSYLGVRMQGFLIRPQAKLEVSSVQHYQSRKAAYLIHLQSRNN